jgi:hypothetical protein
MTGHAALLAVLLLLAHANHHLAAEGRKAPRTPTVRVLDKTTVVGETDPVLWRQVLAVLPVRPTRIEILDLDALSAATRRRLRGVDGFVLAGQNAIVVVRQGGTMRQAELGDAVDRLVLASLIWHEQAHASGLDEAAAFGWEQALWRRFITTGRVDAGTGLAYIARLEEERSKVRRRPESIRAGHSGEDAGRGARQPERHDRDGMRR